MANKQDSREAYIHLLDKMKDIFQRKNAGYAGATNPDPWANFRQAENFGVSPLQGCLVRMSDKYTRIGNLIKNPDNEQVGEPIVDTLIDLASYALIAICLYNESGPDREPMDDGEFIELVQQRKAYKVGERS